MEIVEESIVVASENENQMNLLNTTKVRKKTKILDSDSESEEKSNEEGNVAQELSDEEMERDNLNNSSDKKKLKRFMVIDSDSDDDLTVNTNSSQINNKEKQDIVQINSDIEEVVEEEEVTPHNKSFPDEETAVEAVIYTSNSKGELLKQNAPNTIQNPLSVLCDSESEEEIERGTDTMDEEKVEPQIYRKSQKKNNNERPKRMSALEAAKQRTEIRTESQRMLRESNISLPYHKPKSYTIKEFLQKRSKLTSAVPPLPKAPPSVAIKMSKDQLKEVSKRLDERMKEVEEFYKSESEEEEETKDDPSDEIRSWLNFLVDNAVDAVECKVSESRIEETEENEEVGKLVEKYIKQQESMDYEFNLEDDNENEASRKTQMSELLKYKLDIQPKLSGTPDDIIDFDEGVTKPSGVKKLVEKFLQNTAKKVPHKHKVQLDVIEVGSGGEIVKETVSMNVDEEEEPATVETPGAKLKKLREELEIQMAQKRLELWKQKHEQGDCLTVEKKPDYEETVEEKDILDDEEEEFEMTESESDEMEDDEEEYDVEPKKPKVKSAFIDEEADEDAEADADDDMDDNNEDPANEDDDGSEDDIDEEVENEEMKNPKKKVLKRILKPFSVDSDEEDEEQSQASEETKTVKYFTTDEDDVIPPNLPRIGKTPQRTQLDRNKSEFDFLTPVTYLTGLQNLNSDSKFSKDSPSSPVPPMFSSSQETSSQSQVQKNLFPENTEQSQNTQSTIDDLAELCSGTFPQTQNCESEKIIESELVDELPSTQDLLNLCSGNFSATDPTNIDNTIPENLETKKSEKELLPKAQNNSEEIKNLDEESDQIISQLLDEDELERFKKKFESPINSTFRKSHIPEDVEEVNATGLINSDDENEGLEIKTKKRKKLVFSDDEESDEPDEDEEEEEDERIDLQDEDDEEQQLENEIVARESNNFKATDFFDKEAELSESEWGSADEDEKGLDELEEEQGDQEKFNENKMRSELERIHMRQLLDEDNREVKLLQELLLEDGELHGTGRKRQFRWKALDSEDNGEFDKRDDDDIFLDEEESEEHWRKMRHKREMFLKKKSAAIDDVDSILSDSQILKVGQQIFKSKLLGSQNITPVDKPEEDCKEPFKLLSKRGSFLSRNDQVLQRLAEYTKVTTTVGTTAKNSKSFVFQTVEVSETLVKDNNNKRKATEGTPNVIKKLRLDGLSPAAGKKSTGKSSKVKKLFGNW